MAEASLGAPYGGAAYGGGEQAVSGHAASDVIAFSDSAAPTGLSDAIAFSDSSSYSTHIAPPGRVA